MPIHIGVKWLIESEGTTWTESKIFQELRKYLINKKMVTYEKTKAREQFEQ